MEQVQNDDIKTLTLALASALAFNTAFIRMI